MSLYSGNKNKLAVNYVCDRSSDSTITRNDFEVQQKKMRSHRPVGGKPGRHPENITLENFMINNVVRNQNVVALGMLFDF